MGKFTIEEFEKSIKERFATTPIDEIVAKQPHERSHDEILESVYEQKLKNYIRARRKISNKIKAK